VRPVSFWVIRTTTALSVRHTGKDIRAGKQSAVRPGEDDTIDLPLQVLLASKRDVSVCFMLHLCKGHENWQ